MGLNQYSQLLYFLKGIAENNTFVNTVTKGSIDKIDWQKANIYPLVHISVNQAQFTNGQTILFDVILTCVTERDINKEIVTDDKFWSNDNETDNHNESLAILNNLWTQILRDWQETNITTSENAPLTMIDFEMGNILDGWSLEFQVELPNDTMTLCDSIEYKVQLESGGFIILE